MNQTVHLEELGTIQPEPDPLAGPVREICARLQRAYRTVRLYPEGHSMVESRLEPLRELLAEFLSVNSSLALHVEESALTYRAEIVYTQEDFRDDMAFVMFREGIRVLSLHPGLDEDELRTLVNCLSRAPELDAADQDLITTLWEADFVHIDYEIVDPLLQDLTGVSSLEALRTQTRERIENLLQADLSRTTPGWSADDAAPRGVDLRSGTLVTPDDLVAVEWAVKAEPRPLDQLTEVLLEMLVCSSNEPGQTSSVSALSTVLRSLLAQGNLEPVTQNIHYLLELKSEHPEHAELYTAVLLDLCSVESLRPLVAGLDGGLQARQGEIEQLLLLLLPPAYPALLQLLAEAQGLRARKSLLNVLTAAGAVPKDLVKQHMADPRWYVVRNMVLLVGASRDPSAAASLYPALHNTDERVRREAVRSLTDIGDPRCAPMMRRALQDRDPPVRVLAARAVARLNDRGAADELLRLVTAPGFAGRDQAEIAAFFDAIGQVAADTTVPALERLWADRLLRSEPLPLRLGAISSLACMRSQLSKESLERARHSRNREVREAAEQAFSRPGGLPTAPAARAEE